MDYGKYIQKYYVNASSVKRKEVMSFLKKTEEAIGDKDWNIALIDKDCLCKIFYIQRGNSISRSHYQKIKEHLCNLLDYYSINVTIPSRTDVLDANETIGFFKDLPSLIDFIDRIGAMQLPDYNKQKDLVVLKSIVILGWYGLSSKEIVNLNKNDLIYGEPCKIYRTYSSYIEIPQQYFLILSNLESLDEYRGLPSGKMQVFKGDDNKLFRPIREGSDSFDEGNLMQTIKRFNKIIPPYLNTSICFRNLWKNAMFVNIHEDTSDDSLLIKITKHMHCSKHGALNYRDQYCKWLQQYGEEK